MGTNWLPGQNPETMPKLRYIPKIALPTVFGDALSYMEMINQINFHFNKAIDDINKLADDINKTVEEAVEGAKIPVYANLLHNGSNILSPNNWYIDDPEAIYEGMGEGRMCILFGQVSFNSDGVPVVDETNNAYFVLTEYNQNSTERNTIVVNTTFVSYDESSVKTIEIVFTHNANETTAEVISFSENELPNINDLIAIYNVIGKNVCVYKGDVRVGESAEQYIELTDNGIGVDLSDFFVVQDEGTMYAAECAPCIVIDYYNGRVGQLKFGGVTNPWVRIYGTGVTVNADLYDDITSINQDIGNLRDDIGSNTRAIDQNTDDIAGLQGQINDINNEIDANANNAVAYTAQTKNSTQKSIARNNIGAAPIEDPQFIGELTLNSGYGYSVNFTVTRSGDNVILYFDPVRVQINGLLDPTSAQMAATKNYVDNAVQGVDAVKYSAQTKSIAEQEQARANIGAVGTDSPRFYTTVEIENERKVLSIMVGDSNGQKTVTLGGTTGDALVKNVADPVVESDAANKRYVDNKLGEMNSAVLYVPQTLTESQRNVARSNISARADDDNNFYDYLEIENNFGDDYSDKFITLNWTSSDHHTQKFIDIKYDGSGVKIIDEENASVDLYLGENGNDKVITKEAMNAALKPISITINSSENAWTVVDPPQPSYSNLVNIISAYGAGRNVIVNYPTTGVVGVGYAPPKCASADTGIIAEAYNGVAWKRYVINNDGTVTTTAL